MSKSKAGPSKVAPNDGVVNSIPPVALVPKRETLLSKLKDPAGGITRMPTLDEVLDEVNQQEDWEGRDGHFYFSGVLQCFRKAWYKTKGANCYHGVQPDSCAECRFDAGKSEPGKSTEEGIRRLYARVMNYGRVDGPILNDVRFSIPIEVAWTEEEESQKKPGKFIARNKKATVYLIGKTDTIIQGDNQRVIGFTECKSPIFIFPAKITKLTAALGTKRVPLTIAGITEPERPDGVVSISQVTQLAIGAKVLEQQGRPPETAILQTVSRSNYRDHIEVLVTPEEYGFLYDLALWWVREAHINNQFDEPPAPEFFAGYECVAPETPVLTAEGYKPIREIRVGEQVQTRQGLRPVSAVMRQPIGERQAYDLKPFYGEPLTVTGNHPILVNEYHGTAALRTMATPKWMTAEDLHAAYSKRGPNERYRMLLSCRTEERPLPADMTAAHIRLLGYFMAEGCYDKKRKSGNGHHGMMWVLGQHEPDFAEDIRDDMTLAFNVGHRVAIKPVSHRQGASSSLQVRLTASAVTDWMHQYSLGTHAPNKRFADEVILWPLSAQRILLGALMRGDGWVGTNRGTPMATYATASHALALQVQEMFLRQGVLASVVTAVQKTGFSVGGTIHYVHVRQSKRFGRKVGDGLFEVPIQRMDRIDYDGEVWDITVPDAHEFVTSSGIVHNCGYCPFQKACEMQNKRTGEQRVMHPIIPGIHGRIEALHEHKPAPDPDAIVHVTEKAARKAGKAPRKPAEA